MKKYKDDDFGMNLLEPTENIKVYDVEIDKLKIHPLANINPMMTDVQFKSHMNSIELEGQKDPILIYRDLIIDGRNRTKALRLLGSKTIKAIELPWNYSKEDLLGVVMSKENRRHLTQSQIAVKALGMWKGALGMEKIFKTKKMASTALGVSQTAIDNARYVLEHNGEDKLKDLYNTGSTYYNNRTINNIVTLYNEIKTKIDKETENMLKGGSTINKKDNDAINAYVKLIIDGNTPDISLEVAKRIYMKIKQIKE